MEKREEEILSNIIQLRVKKKITQKELGEKLSVSESAYSKIESGKSRLSYAYLSKIASSLGMSIIELLAYPDTCIIEKPAGKFASPRVTLQIDLEDNVKADVIKLAFGDRVLEINYTNQ